MKKSLKTFLSLIPVLLLLIFTSCPAPSAQYTSPTVTGSPESNTPAISSITSTNMDSTKPTPTFYTPAVLPRPEVTRISALELNHLIETNADIIIADTRSAAEYNNGHIPGAVNAPSYPGGTLLTNQLKTFAKDKLIILYCD